MGGRTGATGDEQRRRCNGSHRAPATRPFPPDAAGAALGALMRIDLLRRLCQTPGVPGREERVRALIEQEVKGLFDEIRTDPMGSLICTRRGRTSRRRATSATRVMIAAHMDEIGFYVRHVGDDGFLCRLPGSRRGRSRRRPSTSPVCGGAGTSACRAAR